MKENEDYNDLKKHTCTLQMLHVHVHTDVQDAGYTCEQYNQESFLVSQVATIKLSTSMMK